MDGQPSSGRSLAEARVSPHRRVARVVGTHPEALGSTGPAADGRCAKTPREPRGAANLQGSATEVRQGAARARTAGGGMKNDANAIVRWAEGQTPTDPPEAAPAAKRRTGQAAHISPAERRDIQVAYLTTPGATISSIARDFDR